MKISNLLPDTERHYLSNLLRSGAGELPDSEGNISPDATHRFVVDKGFIVGAIRIVNEGNKHGLRNRSEVDEFQKEEKEKKEQEKEISS